MIADGTVGEEVLGSASSPVDAGPFGVPGPRGRSVVAASRVHAGTDPLQERRAGQVDPRGGW